jgi:YadA head domain repeat (2 copies)
MVPTPAMALRAACGQLDPAVAGTFVPLGTPTGTFAVVCGDGANANGNNATAIGHNSHADGTRALSERFESRGIPESAKV